MSLLGRLLIIAGLKNDPDEIPPEERVLKTFREKLNVYRVEKSRVIVIEISSEDPKLAAEIPNAIADAYLAVQRGAKLQSNADATDWLEPEIADLSKRVKEAEARVAAFRSQSDLLIGQNNSVLATQQLSELSTELSRVRANRGARRSDAAERARRAEQRRLARRAAGGAVVDADPAAARAPGAAQGRHRRSVDHAARQPSAHPRAALAACRPRRPDPRRGAEGPEGPGDARRKTAQLREKQLVADLNTLKAESARAGEEEVELRALEREAAAQRELLESYLTRYREASSRKDRNYLPADARIFSRAVVPSEPYFPKIVPIVGAAFVGSLLIMAIVTLLQELFTGRAMRPAPGARFEPVADVRMPAVRADEPDMALAGRRRRGR